MTILTSALRPIASNTLRAAVATPRFTALAPTELYKLLWRYYLSNQLYDDITHFLRDNQQSAQDIRELRNPANRVIAFHTAKLWPGALPNALPIRTKNPKIIEPIHQIWKWSNFGPKKQMAARWFALFGDMFLKVAEKESDGERRVFIQVIDPRNVTDFVTDERGYVQYIRIDVPQQRTDWKRGLIFNDTGHYETRTYVRTEIWDKDTVRIFENDGSDLLANNKLGTPNQDSQQHGLGFVPVAWTPFYDTGETRGMGAFTHTLSKIDEANRMATRLHQLLFRNNKVTWALEANMMDASGRPLPAPVLAGFGNTPETDSIELADEMIVRLPGMSTLKPLIPSLDYNAALAILNAQMEELRNDLPELNYFDLQAKTHMSGSLVRTALADAADRVIETRGNGEAAIARANAMALTIAQRANLPIFSQGAIGSFADGDFDHTFAERAVFSTTSDEQAQTISTLLSAGLPLPSVLKHEGWMQDEIDEVQEQRIAELKRQLDIQKQQAEAAVELPLTEEQIATILPPYVQAGVPLENVLPRVGWSKSEVDAMVKQRTALQQEAQAQADKQQQAAMDSQLAIHKQQLETQAAVSLKTQQQQASIASQQSAPDGAQPPKSDTPAQTPATPPKGVQKGAQ